MTTELQNLTRRRLLQWAAMAPALCGRLYAASDFWNKKAPADWSSDEVHQLLNKSPWAKEVTASRPASPGGYGGGRGMGGMGRMGGMGGGGMGRGGGGGQQIKGLVRWESAKPILEASKETLPDAFANHYVISLTDFPLGGRRNDSSGDSESSDSALDRIKAELTLTPNDKAAAQAGVAQMIGSSLLLGFSSDSLKLTPDDKEVAFATSLGRLTIKTKFTLKDMLYHENLAV